MKIQIDVTDKEKKIFYRIMAIVLIMMNFALLKFALPELDKTVPNRLNYLVATGIIFMFSSSSLAIFKHYWYKIKNK